MLEMSTTETSEDLQAVSVLTSIVVFEHLLFQTFICHSTVTYTHTVHRGWEQTDRWYPFDSRG